MNDKHISRSSNTTEDKSETSDFNEIKNTMKEQEKEEETREYYKYKEKQIERRRAQYKTIVVLLTCLTCSLILLLIDSKVSVLSSLQKNWNKVTALAILFGGLAYFIHYSVGRLSSFQDVDIRQRLTSTNSTVPPTWPFPAEEWSVTEDVPEHERTRAEMSAFYKYFKDITKSLEQKALNAEEKGSILLDKGTTYTIYGVLFYVLSIIGWQIAAWIHGFQQEFLYGMASCTGLFIFIEFLSAWFLKQYRHFTDISTYLLKVKAIFDKFILVYLAHESLEDSLAENKAKSAEILINMLEKDINWPDSYLLKKPEISFANDAMNAVSSLAKELRKATKKTKENKEQKDK